MDKNNILILCKVVDNYGDIGVVYRLAKALSRLRPELNLAIVVSNLDSFKSLCPAVNPSQKTQTISFGKNTWRIVDWNIHDAGAAGFDVGKYPIILECFQCGRPQWLEDVLFSDDFTGTAHIVNIDYLTAEEYADDFHLLKSGTRKTTIKKINFMPGFTKNTGSLILEKNQPEKQPREKKTFDVLIFSYERDFLPIVNALKDFGEKKRLQGDFCVRTLVAAGKSAGPFRAAWESCQKPFCAQFLDFLPQEEWDALLEQADFLFVRGEDSLSRACLSGIPFVWHAYVQEDEYQLVKVNALLERMRPFFCEEDFSIVALSWRTYNTSVPTGEEKTALENNIALMLDRRSIRKSFAAFSASLFHNGDMAEHLLSYIDTISMSADNAPCAVNK